MLSNNGRINCRIIDWVNCLEYPKFTAREISRFILKILPITRLFDYAITFRSRNNQADVVKLYY